MVRSFGEELPPWWVVAQTLVERGFGRSNSGPRIWGRRNSQDRTPFCVGPRLCARKLDPMARRTNHSAQLTRFHFKKFGTQSRKYRSSCVKNNKGMPNTL